MTVRQNRRQSQQVVTPDPRLLRGVILAVLAVATLALTRSPEAVPVVVAPVALAFGIKLV